MIKGWSQETVHNARILVVGAGTTGNEVIKNLALLGVGEITIVDSDLVEEVNLNRCVLFRKEDIDQSKSETAAKRALELNPDIRAIGLNCDVIYDFGNFQYRNFDCVILTVDNLEARMWVNRYCWLNNTPLIDTGIDGLVGNVFVMIPPFESCLECDWSTREYQRLAEKYSCSKIGLALEERKIPMVITSASVIGGIAAQESIRILLHGNKRDVPYPRTPQLVEAKAPEQVRASDFVASKAGVFFHYDGETGAFLTWQVSRKEECPAHACVPDPSQILFEASLNDTVESIRERVRNILGASTVEIKHDKEIVYSVVCNNCGHTQTIAPCLLGKFRRFLCPECGLLTIVADDHTEELRDGYTLRSLCIPPNHLLRVVFSKENAISEAWILSR
ncbi:ThiF family adenylyltransferase [Candidatus Poribacteria bacterium]|nr:ThiF family adenylyltransferase [Candidatus Poribacteria bacterium]